MLKFKFNHTMERRNRFLIGLTAALITFGSLMAFVGPKHFHHPGRFHHEGVDCQHGPRGFRDGDCYKHGQDEQEQAPEKPQNSGQ